MKSLAERYREDRRLVLLRLLSEQPGYRSNSSILHAGLSELNVAATRDDVLTDLSWLRDQGLVRIDDSAVSRLYLVEITERGADVAKGNAIVPGVARPSPK